MSERCIHGFVAQHCTTCRTCLHGLIGSRCPQCLAIEAAKARPARSTMRTAVADPPARRTAVATRRPVAGGSAMNALGRALGARSARTVPVTRQSTGRLVEVPTFLRSERRWTGELPRTHRTIPNKAALDFEGDPLYPEFVLLRLLERAGWGAAWRKTWGGAAFWSDIGLKIEPPAWVTSVCDQVSAHTGWAGAWEIVAWRARRVLFLQSRPVGNDRVGAYQARWLDTALSMGLPLDAFAIVEYQA